MFFRNIKDSVYSPAYYKELLVKPFSYSLKYYALFALLVSFLISVVLSFFVPAQVTRLLDNIGTKITDNYPADLVLTVKDGIVSTNVEEPYFIKMPEDLANAGKDVDVNGAVISEYKNILVINTKEDFNVERFNQYSSFALLTKDSIAFHDKEGSISVKQIEKSVNFVLDKNTVVSGVNKLQPFLKFIYPLFTVLVFIGVLLAFVGCLAYLLLGALLIWLVAKMKGVVISYGKAYQLGLHLVTLGVILMGLILVLRLTFHIPFLFTIVLVIMAAVNINKATYIEVPNSSF